MKKGGLGTMSCIFREGRRYDNTDMICKRCKSPVWESDNPEYEYQCFNCNEDLYSFEVEEQNGLYLPPVIVGRHINGITLNDYEWLLDNDGKEMVFKNQAEAEAFLLKNGFTQKDLEWMIFMEVEQNGNNQTAPGN